MTKKNKYNKLYVKLLNEYNKMSSFSYWRNLIFDKNFGK